MRFPVPWGRDNGTPEEGARRYSVIVPAFNEEEIVGRVIEEILDVTAKSGAEAEIIVVDDGSEDSTSERAAGAGAVVIRNPKNMGYGYSLKRGILAAKNEIVVITDADGTYPVEMIPHLVTLADEFDMVVGKRTGKYYKGNLVKRVTRPLFKLISEYVTGTEIPDINSGMRVMRRSFIEKYGRAISTGFSFTTTVTLLSILEGKTVDWVPIPYEKRVGTSRVRWIRDTLRAAQIVIEAALIYNPLKIFLLFAAVPFLSRGGALLVEVLLRLLGPDTGHSAAVCRLAIRCAYIAVSAIDISMIILALGALGVVIVGRSGRD